MGHDPGRKDLNPGEEKRDCAGGIFLGEGDVQSPALLCLSGCRRPHGTGEKGLDFSL